MAELKLSNHTISIVSALGLAWGLAQAWETWNSHLRRLDAIESRLNAMPPQLSAGNRWTCYEHLTFVYELKEQNPKLKVPIPTKGCTP